MSPDSDNALSTDSRALSPPTGEFLYVLKDYERAVALVTEALDKIDQAKHLVGQDYALSAAMDKVRWYSDRIRDANIDGIDRRMRVSVWEHLLKESRLTTVMSARDIDAIRKQLQDNPPPLNEETVIGTFTELFGNRHASFRKGLYDLFASLCRGFKSNEAFKISKRVILDGAMHTHGGWNHWSGARDQVNDLERIFLLLDGRDPSVVRMDDRLSAILSSARRAKDDRIDTDYFDVRLFKNGNLHIWFKRKDLVDAANKLIAEHYGPTLAAGN